MLVLGSLTPTDPVDCARRARRYTDDWMGLRVDASGMHRPRVCKRSSCPGCGEPIGVYEPIWRFSPELVAERTAWLLLPHVPAPLESLWHASCAEANGIDGG